MAEQPRGVAKRALLIGVDHYPHLDAQYQLAGCVNDAKLMRQVLVEHFEFAGANIIALHNESASREAILAAMERLLSETESDDVVFMHFSGHGSRRTSDVVDEGSGTDNTIMPSDSGRHPLPNLDIVDTEINAWLQRLSAKTRAIGLLFDCCHSGTITRDPFAAKVRAAPDDTRSLVAMGVDAASLPRRAKPRAAGESSWHALSDSYVVMAGCRDDELASEFTDERGGETIRNGAFTHFLASAMIAATPGTTFRDVFDAARSQVTAMFAAQHPHIEGAQDRQLFGATDIVPFRFVSVAAAAGDEITLNGGAAHGVRPGSRWSVFPPAAKSIDGLTPLASISIERVDALTATARALQDRGAIVVGARCIEAVPAVDHYRLKIDLSMLATTAAAVWLSPIAASPLLSLARSSDAADLRLYQLAARDGAAVAASQPVPQLSTLRTASWAVVDRSGALAMSPVACDETDAVARIIGNAEVLARVRNALSLDNPDSRLKVEFNLLREAADGDWRRMQSSGEELTAGDSIAFEIINHEPRAVFISVLDFGVSGRIQLLYPPNARSELMEAEQTLKIGSGRRRIRLGLPDNFSGTHGVESFKLFVTSAETDFSWLQQAGARAPGTARSRLQHLFAAAYDGPTLRDAAMDVGEDESSDWRSMTRTFELRAG